MHVCVHACVPRGVLRILVFVWAGGGPAAGQSLCARLDFLARPPPPLPPPCRQATANLATTIIGAGIMALPRAFATLGVLLGAGCLAAIFGLSLFSLSALVRWALGNLGAGGGSAWVPGGLIWDDGFGGLVR